MPGTRSRVSPAAAVPVALVVLAVALTGCLDPAETAGSAPDTPCISPSELDSADEKVRVRPGAMDLDAGPDGTVYLTYPDSLEVLDRDLRSTACWSLPKGETFRTTRVAAGSGFVAVGPVLVADDAPGNGSGGRGVITYAPDGEEIARRQLPRVAGLTTYPGDRVAVLHHLDGDREGVSVLTRDLQLVDRFPVNRTGTSLRDLERAGDRLYLASDSDVEPREPSRVLVTNLTGAFVDAIDGNLSKPTTLAAGAGLIYVPDHTFGPWRGLWVFSANGSLLWSAENERGASYGVYAIRNGTGYNLRNATLRVQPAEAPTMRSPEETPGYRGGDP